MWESICLTLAATAGNNIGKVLQKKGTIILPPLSLKLKVIRAYAVNKPWALGFIMDIFGALLMLRALSLAPVSVVQPVSGCGLAILSVFSHFYLKEVMNVFDWIGITVAGIGTIGVGAGGEEQKASLISVFQLLWLALVVAILFVVASIVTGVVAGMFALGEKLPTSPSGRLLLLLGWLLIMLGVVLLVTSSRLIRHLPRSFRRSRQTSVERGFNIRRTTSHTPKDTNPSAVIQAATLHHLLSSASKEKD
ncbi:hypothetical protein BRARA_J02187 [Brassica rapa]|uniref:Probable magnesium transporter n=1 Tax=Brassica campestris TaxID=3711 RepID=A0A397XMR9_BRACM|nr:hypothetical protein BRARA_J02187 [Brassica rapa]